MHGDFKYNLMRMNLLKLGKKQEIELDELEEFFQEKGISDVSKEEIKAQLEHLTMENFLSKKSENKYELTTDGQKEVEEVKAAIDKF